MILHDPGTQVGAYRILQTIGHGNFGAVYLAEGLAGEVALKETFDPESIRSFQGEFDILSRLRHDNLPRYHDVFVANDNGYLVMEFVPGRSLEDILLGNSGPLLATQVVGYAVQLCEVLSYLHTQPQPIIHRDIKPANIRLTPDGLIKLVDFGIAKQGTMATSNSRRALTMAYAPIEQYGRGLHTDGRSDIYSLGGTLYHLLTNQEPPSATDRIGTADDPLKLVTAYNTSIPAGLAQAINQAMALKAEDRFATAQQFRQALLAGPEAPRPVRAVPEPAYTRLVTPPPAAPPVAAPRAIAAPPPAPVIPQVRPRESRRDPLPQEIEGLNWGGFLLSFFWAIGHRAWIPALLLFIPFINFTIPFYLLFKGNEIAWRKGQWRNTDHFKAAQRTWVIVGLVLAMAPALACAALFFAVGALAS